MLLFFSPLRGAFDAATVRLLERMAENICSALSNFEREAERTRLSETLQRFRAAIDMSGDTVYLTDAETMRFVDINETACTRLGYTRAELLTMGPKDLTIKPFDEVKAMFDRVIACAPEAIVTEQVAQSRNGTHWISEVSRRAVRAGDRWMIVTISRDITERRRQEKLQALQHSVTHQLSRTGAKRAVIEAVLADLSTALRFEQGLCAIADDEHVGVRRLAAWHRDGVVPVDARADADALALSLDMPPGRVAQCTHDDQRRFIVALRADGKTLGALALQGDEMAPLAQFEHVLVTIGEQLGQYIRRKQAERVLAHSEARFRSLTELSSDWYWECDVYHRFVTFGGRSARDFGKHDWRSAFFGRTVWELPHLVRESADWAAHRSQLMRRERFIDFQFAVRLPDGSLRWTSANGEPCYDADGEFTGYHGVSRDITERRLAEDSIRHLATHDTLTGLPNRTLFIEELGRSMREARRDGRKLALLFVDLDHFKIINDTLGHDAGDMLLARMATSLRECLRPHDLVARLGGDEFVVLVRHPAGHDEAAVVARKLLAAVTQPMSLKGQECRVSASVGISIFPDGADDEAQLMKGADIAMYEAKREGRNAFRFYSTDAVPQSPLRLRMESNLRAAIERNEFTLHFQPKIDLASGRIIGAEALLRWTNAELGSVPPAQFIALAEETGLMLPIGRWVLRQACAQHMAWRDQGLPPIPLSINLSPRQFADAELLPDLERELSTSGMPPQALELEVTESVVISSPERALATLQAVKRTGRAAGDRRLRHRLLVAGAVEALPGRCTEDRPLVHPWPARRQLRRRHHRGDHRHVPHAAADGGGRRRGNPWATRLPARTRLHADAGLPVQQAAAGRRICRARSTTLRDRRRLLIRAPRCCTAGTRRGDASSSAHHRKATASKRINTSPRESISSSRCPTMRQRATAASASRKARSCSMPSTQAIIVPAVRPNVSRSPASV